MGIEEVYDIDQFRSVYRRIRNYALRQFKDEGVLIEQRICGFNHLEVQIVSDRSGKNPVHFGTRHSLALARKVGYDNVGTWEWIVTKDGSPFLMEVNTRIQVENGVSARISKVKGQGDVDIIAEQIRIGLGEPLGYTQEDITFEGVGIEYRLIAEDPDNRFTPWVGRIDAFGWPSHPWLKMHTHVPTDESYEIPTEFDPNLALAIIWGENLEQAKERGMQFLDELTLQGENQSGELKSNVNFLRANTGRILRF